MDFATAWVRAGTIALLRGPLMASGDAFTLKVTGRQTHGAMPWDGVDMLGTLRTYDDGMRDDMVKRMRTTAESIARAIRRCSAWTRPVCRSACVRSPRWRSIIAEPEGRRGNLRHAGESN